MTPDITLRFLEHLDYTANQADSDLIPRDVIWTATSPITVDKAKLKTDTSVLYLREVNAGMAES